MRKSNVNRFLIVILFYSIVVLVGISFVDEIIILAYQSTYIACSTNNFEEKQQIAANMGIRIIGYYNKSNDGVYVNNTRIDLNALNKPKSGTFIHELCHREQYLENRAFSCNKPQLLFLNEVECYIRGKLA